MSKSVQKRIDIFLKVDRESIKEYFNPHDPAPIYKRQLRHDLVSYISSSVSTYTRYTTLRYKITCPSQDKDLIDPFMHAVRRHFQQKEQIKKAEFEKFKKRTYKLLFMSIALVMVCQVVLTLVDSLDHDILSTLGHSLDIFGWVILWNPIDRLVFNWNPYLKELSLLQKLSTSEMIVIETDAVEVNPKLQIRA